LKALVQLKKVGRFACAVIKKRRYWPAFVPGEAISREFDNLELKFGTSLAISGKLDGKEYFFWALKEPSYIMKMMAAGGPLLANDSCGDRSGGGLKGGLRELGHFDSRACTTGITSTVTPLMTTTTCIMLSL
jgi:hypothetical protein